MDRLKQTEKDSKYLRARKRVEELKGFYYNLISFCLVIPFLIFINYQTYWGFQWFWFPIIGWGIGLTIHAFCIFVKKGFLGHEWEQRKLQELMREEEKKWS